MEAFRFVGLSITMRCSYRGGFAIRLCLVCERSSRLIPRFSLAAKGFRCTPCLGLSTECFWSCAAWCHGVILFLITPSVGLMKIFFWVCLRLGYFPGSASPILASLPGFPSMRTQAFSFSATLDPTPSPSVVMRGGKVMRFFGKPCPVTSPRPKSLAPFANCGVSPCAPGQNAG